MTRSDCTATSFRKTEKRVFSRSATEGLSQQRRDNEQVEKMGSNNHNSSSSSIIALAGASAAPPACDWGAMLLWGVASFSEAIMAPSRPGRLGLCFLNGEPTAWEAPLVVIEGLPSDGGVPAVAGPALNDCGVPTEGDPGVDFFVELSDIGSAECCRLS
jgi:hypothetical protein